MKVLNDRMAIICISVVASLVTTGSTLLALTYFGTLGASSATRALEVNRLVLRTDKGDMAAELKSEQGRTELILYSTAQKEALKIGVDQLGKYIHFLDDNRSLEGGWNQVGEFGEGTICLGDKYKPASVCLGAYPRELGEIHLPSDKWGLSITPGERFSGEAELYSFTDSARKVWFPSLRLQNKSKKVTIVP